jgi:hypothetical protein
MKNPLTDSFSFIRRVSHVMRIPYLIVTRYPVCSTNAATHHALSRLRDSVRGPVYCPLRGPLKASTLLHGLSRRNKTPHPILRYSGLNGSLFFIMVHAMISSLAESFTRILVLIPFSRCLPRTLLVNHMINARSLLEVIIAA